MSTNSSLFYLEEEEERAVRQLAKAISLTKTDLYNYRKEKTITGVEIIQL